MVSETYLENIKYINHIKNGFFYYDKIEIIEKNRVETFGIYNKTICKDFIKLINIVKEKPPAYDNLWDDVGFT
jgi:hypothetical protein